MNGKFGANDFYGHPPASRLPKGLIAALLLLALLICAMAWSESNLAATYRAEQIAKEEAAKLGLALEARPRKKKSECG